MHGLYFLALVIVIVCALSDFFDGYLARKWSAVSEIGAILDPFADRFFCACGFVSLMILGRCPSWFVALLVSVAILQNAGYVALRLTRTRQSLSLQAIGISKWNMALQCIWIALEFGFQAYEFPVGRYLNTERAIYLFLAGVQMTVFFQYFQRYKNLLIPHFRALLFKPT